MRILHRRHDHAGPRPAAKESQPIRCGYPRSDAAQSLPLRDAYAHPSGRAPGGRPDEDRGRHTRCRWSPTMSALSRRSVLAGTGSLVIGFSAIPQLLAQEAGGNAPPSKPPLPGSLKTNPYLDSWIRIAANGSVTVFTGKAELGQGIKTALLQVAAEQLDMPFSALKLVTADTGQTANEGFTSGSQSMQNSATAIMHAAAQARAILLGEAARRFFGTPDQLKTADGFVTTSVGRKVSSG